MVSRRLMTSTSCVMISRAVVIRILPSFRVSDEVTPARHGLTPARTGPLLLRYPGSATPLTVNDCEFFADPSELQDPGDARGGVEQAERSAAVPKPPVRAEEDPDPRGVNEGPATEADDH